MGNSVADPSSLSRKRFVTLISSVLVAIGSGSNYVYSAYAPQLGNQLNITHTQLNIIGLAGNVGVYATGPFWGRLVDRRGPQPLLISSFVSLFIGYYGIRYFYDAADGQPGAPEKLLDADAGNGMPTLSLSFLLVVFCMFLTGCGGNSGLCACINATAKSFPDKTRATTTGIVISGFGLSAVLFSTLAHALFPGNTSAMLLLLALGTSFPMLIGILFVRTVPLPASELVPPSERMEETRDIDVAEESAVDGELMEDVDVLAYKDSAALSGNGTSSHTPLLSHQIYSNEEEDAIVDSVSRSISDPSHRRSRSRMSVLDPLRIGRRRSVTGGGGVPAIMQDLHGKTLWTSLDFWLLFVIMSLVSGTGLMYINNVGSISQALFASHNPTYDEIAAAKSQSMQVSIISMGNFAARILAGLGADYIKNRLYLPRSYCLMVMTALFVLSQITASLIEDPEKLWRASALLGLAYGSAFGLFPVICIEWFGLTHFSENWGYLSLSPVIAGNLFSLAFGRNLDEHAETDSSDALSSSLPLPSLNSALLPSPTNAIRSLSNILRRAGGVPPATQCFQGKSCYVASLYMTIFACTLAFFLSVYAGYRDRRRMSLVANEGGVSLSHSRSRSRSGEVVWDAGEG